MSLARRAVDAIFSLDPKTSAPYVLLTNKYPPLGRCDRGELCERNDKKEEQWQETKL